MIDCGIGKFSDLDSTLNVGDIVSTRVTFNKTFDKAPIVVVSMAEYSGSKHFSHICVDGRYVDANSFKAVAIIKNISAVGYPWYFDWIAIST